MKKPEQTIGCLVPDGRRGLPQTDEFFVDPSYLFVVEMDGKFIQEESIFLF